jgi:hypothetical protein
MSIDTETFARYARAEKDLCQKAGAAMSKIIKEVEESHGLKIAEMRPWTIRISQTAGPSRTM